MTESTSEHLPIGRAADVPERGGLAVHVGRVEIGVFRTPEGFLAIENACPHAGVPLSTGEVDDCIVTCPAHGFQYDLRTGHAADYADGFPIPRFAVIESEGELFLAADRDEDGEWMPRPLPRVPAARADTPER